MRDSFLSMDISLQIPIVEVCEVELQTWCLNFRMIQQWLTSPRSKFYWNRFGCMREKESYDVKDISLTSDIFFANSDDESVLT